MSIIKYKSAFFFAAISGILGFVFHLIWHFMLNIELFSFAPHNLWGFIHTVIGIIIGIFAWYLLNRKSLK